MVKALRIQEKVKQVGFEWENKEQVWDKVIEEANELKEEVLLLDKGEGKQEKMEEELGDLLFSVVNYARFLNIDPDQALARTNKKFMQRFQAMEDVVGSQGKKMTDLTLLEMDAIWNTVKLSEKH
jgi:XTP/dITP diphosphohydrolase